VSKECVYGVCWGVVGCFFFFKQETGIGVRLNELKLEGFSSRLGWKRVVMT
jgi:hypothetical protein